MDRAVANTGRGSADIINTWDGGHLASRQVGYFRVAAAELPAAAAVTAAAAAAAGWRCEAWDTTLTPDVSRDVTCCLLSELHFIFKIFSFLPSRNKYS